MPKPCWRSLGRDIPGKAIYRAAEFCDPSVLDYFARLGADLAHAKPDGAAPDGDSLLMATVAAGNVPAVRYLLGRGLASVNAADSFGRTALLQAVDAGDLEMVKALVSFGARSRIQDISGRSAWSDCETYLGQGARSERGKYLKIRQALLQAAE